MDDRMIIDLFLVHDESAITETEKAYGISLRRFSERILGSFEDAEEVANDCYLSSWRLIPPNKPYDYFRQFLMRIVRHLSFDRLRVMKAEKRSAEITELTREMEECLPGNGSTEEAVEEKLLRETLNAWLLGLSPEHRAFFVRRYYFAESVREIASHTGASESRIKTALHRTRSALRDYLEEEGYLI